jgi:DNA polymerase III epsilon subunit-like protein
MKFIAIDTETHLLPPEGKYRSEHHVPDMVCASFSYSGSSDDQVLTWHEKEEMRGRLDWAWQQGWSLVFHNAAFDLAVLSKWLPELEGKLKNFVSAGRVLDTMVLYALRYPLTDRRRSLAAIHRHLFRESLDKSSVRLSYRRDRHLTEAQRIYALQDAIATLRVATRLLEIPYGGLAEVDESVTVAAQPLYDGPEPDVLYSQAAAYMAWYLEPEGLAVNHDTVAEHHARLTTEEKELCADLYDHGLMRAERPTGAVNRVVEHRTIRTEDTRWTVRSRDPLVLYRRAGNRKDGYHTIECDGKWTANMAVVRAKFAEAAVALSLDPPKTDTGEISLDGDYWGEYVEELPADIQAYTKLVRCRKYLSSYVGPLYHQRPERVYPHYRVAAAETARWACWRPPQQQQPKLLRPMYGGRMVGADFKSLECFTTAHCMKALGISGPMMEVLAHEDFHTFVAQQVGVERQPAKIATFGLAGGMGNKAFYKYMRYTNKLDVTFDEACAVRRKWLNYFTDVTEYLNLFRVNYYDLCPHYYTRKAWLESLGFDLDEGWPSNFELSRAVGGRITVVLPSGRVIPQRNFSQAANAFFQGTGADVMTLAFTKACQSGIQTCGVVHDSAYTTQLDQGPRLTDAMHLALQEVCPTVADIAPVPVPEEGETFF